MTKTAELEQELFKRDLDDLVSKFQARIQELEAELRCPIGLDKNPSLCSAGSCSKCIAERLKCANEQLSGVHAGTMQCVPVEPTEAMVNAAFSHLAVSRSWLRKVYRAMLKASKETE